MLRRHSHTRHKPDITSRYDSCDSRQDFVLSRFVKTAGRRPVTIKRIGDPSITRKSPASAVSQSNFAQRSGSAKLVHQITGGEPVTIKFMPNSNHPPFFTGRKIDCDSEQSPGFRTLFRPGPRDTSRVYGEGKQHNPGIPCWATVGTHATGWRVLIMSMIDTLRRVREVLLARSGVLVIGVRSEMLVTDSPRSAGAFEPLALSGRLGGGDTWGARSLASGPGTSSSQHRLASYGGAG